MKYRLELTVNGESYEELVDPYTTLLDVLRENLSLTGTKRGCEDGRCGSCTVIVDGKIVKSCIINALCVSGYQITTIEGVAVEERLDPLQEAFIESGALQCGYCVPGFILSSRVLLDENPNPREEEIREVLKGNLCRCGIYTKVTQAVLQAAASDESIGSR